MKEIADLQRYSSPTVTPQALAWDGKQLWISSRDLGTLYRTECDGLKPHILPQEILSEGRGGYIRSHV